VVVHLHAAFVPPTRLLDGLTDLVRAQEPPLPAPPQPVERRTLLGRKVVAQPEAPEAVGPLLDILDHARMWVPITDFGFVQAGVARSLVGSISRAAARFEPPRVALRGGSALVDENDRSVWVELRADDGAIEVMRGIAREVVDGVEQLGFYCDRRQFRTRIPLATVNDRTTVEHLEKVMAALDAHVDDMWVVDAVAVLQRGSAPFQMVPIGAESEMT
jgi:hypothetical protein